MSSWYREEEEFEDALSGDHLRRDSKSYQYSIPSIPIAPFLKKSSQDVPAKCSPSLPSVPAAAMEIKATKQGSCSSFRAPTPNMVMPTVDGYTVSHSLLRNNLPQDFYGFIIDERNGLSLSLYQDFEQRQVERVVKQRKTWERLVLVQKDGLTVFPPPCDRVKRALRRGLPPELRPDAWYYYSGAQARHEAEPKKYHELTKYISQHEANITNSPLYNLIESDVSRVFSGNVKFNRDPLTSPFSASTGPCCASDDSLQQAALKRILTAISLAYPNISYIPGLTLIAAAILLVTRDELRSFWIFVAVLEEHLPFNFFVDMSLGCNVDQEVLLALLQWKSPQIHQRLSDLQLSPGIVTSTWFTSLFVEQLPFEVLARLWDTFLMEGSKVLLRMAWALFKIHERSIVNFDDYFDLLAFIKNMPRGQINVNELFDEAFEGIGSFPARWIEEQRAKFLPELRAKHSVRKFSRLTPAFIPIITATSTTGKEGAWHPFSAVVFAQAASASKNNNQIAPPKLHLALESDDMPIFTKPVLIESESELEIEAADATDDEFFDLPSRPTSAIDSISIN